MIPKPLNDIEWSDIEALRDSGREEDDAIEYKASFSGGSDYIAFNDAQRVKAIEGIAREAVAFLNGRGGDIVIGVRESANDHPKIEEITPVQNVVQTVDRLAQSLAALIEPTQTVLTLRAIRPTDGASEGVVIVRCPSSLRAPHRFTPTKQCYIRRGREAVPMPMDEIQDLTLRRADSQSERLALLDEQFVDIGYSRVGRQNLSAHRIHFRSCFVPLNRTQVLLEPPVLDAFRGGDPELEFNGKRERNDVAFREMAGKGYRPILRGMSRESYTSGGQDSSDFAYASKTIRSDGVMKTDFSCRWMLRDRTGGISGFHISWIAGYLANSITSIVAVQKVVPSLAQGVFRVAVYADGSIAMRVGEQMWAENLIWPVGTVAIPDFDIGSMENWTSCFRQLQIDIASIPGLENPPIYSLVLN